MPRIPGGEITPEKLIVIGEVARDFGLYTKITGGQRIDLFGARMEELPAIWRRLVDAGFESGHAYGKSLRTVKSCVGSTWCRFGVQDSVGLAIELEIRYRGLRSPHKLKGGVSGCARECAEARSKDFGVIATEKGWNLYVGGNGGATPAHAQLLAGDLDTETLVSYLDRFLMYYIRTADRLQRTAPWVDALDGGLDRVRAVVVDDVLGLGAELEAAMAQHVDGYFDEWKATIEDPEKLKRFVSFVNAPDIPDPNISFEVRGQIVAGEDGADKGPVSLGATIPVGAPDRGSSQLLRGTKVCPLDELAVRARRDRPGARAGRRGVPDPRQRGVRAGQPRPVQQGVGARPRDRRHTRGGRHAVRRLADAQAGLRPSHRQCLDDPDNPDVAVMTYDVQVVDGVVEVAARRS